MDANIVLLFNIPLISLSLLVLSKDVDRLWIVVHGTIVGMAVAAWFLAWNNAGYILLALSLPTVIAPLILMGTGMRLSYSGKTAAAARLCRLAALFHPSTGWRINAAMMQALAEPSTEEQCAALERVERDWGRNWGYAARLYRLRLLNDWRNLLALPEPARHLRKNMDALYYLVRVQAFGALGRLEEMAECYLAGRRALDNAYMTEQALMWVLAYSGKYRAVGELLATPKLVAMKSLDADGREWMVELARLSAGHGDARPRLERLAGRMRDPLRRLQKTEQLAGWSPAETALKPDLSGKIDRETDAVLARTAVHAERRFTPVILALIGANLLGYVYQLATGDPYSSRDLAMAGGMWPPYVLEGDWWRLPTALFLHAGWLHLAFNMIALYVLGVQLERRAGSWVTALVYGIGGVFSSALVCWLMVEGWIGRAVLVGASGAVLSLFGALTAMIAFDWFRTRTLRSRAALLTLGYVILIQVLADFAVPGVSFAAHAAGFAAGLSIGAIFFLFRR